MPPELFVVCDVGARLDAAGLPYMLTGSICLAFYATPRMTRDIDIVIALRAAQTQRLADALGQSYSVDIEMVRSEAGRSGMFNVFHDATAIKVDFIVRKSEPYRLAEFDRRQQVHVDGRPLWIVSREDLILSKLAWARESKSDYQLRDVRALMGGPLDLAYINSWIRELELLGIWQIALSP
jgi:hypothetical protein